MTDAIRKAIEESREREKKATPGPWEATYADEECYSAAVYANGVANGSAAVGTIHSGDDDAEFIAHARTDVSRFREALAVAVEALGCPNPRCPQHRNALTRIAALFEEAPCPKS